MRALLLILFGIFMKFVRICFTLIVSLPFSIFAASSEEQCELYPITVPHSLVSSSTPGTVFNRVPIGNGYGNYGWLTWNGANDANTIANSLVPPGDSENYINPYDSDDHLLEVNDWVQGSTGVNNSRKIRDRLNALIGEDIIIPFWLENTGQGL